MLSIGLKEPPLKKLSGFEKGIPGAGLAMPLSPPEHEHSVHTHTHLQDLSLSELSGPASLPLCIRSPSRAAGGALTFLGEFRFPSAGPSSPGPILFQDPLLQPRDHVLGSSIWSQGLPISSPGHQGPLPQALPYLCYSSGRTSTSPPPRAPGQKT